MEPYTTGKIHEGRKISFSTLVFSYRTNMNLEFFENPQVVCVLEMLTNLKVERICSHTVRTVTTKFHVH